MTATTCPPGYQAVRLSEAKIALAFQFLVGITEGPAEAAALLHTLIARVDAENSATHTAAQLGAELTFCLIASGLRES